MAWSSVAMNVGWAIPAFILVMSVIVLVHEYGHYIVGRWCGVKIDSFSLGFGPEIFAFVDKRGTRWRLAAIPLGGYVKFHGDANGASMPDASGLAAMSTQERAVTLEAQPVWKRAAIVAAGPIANFILAIAIFAGGYMTVGRPIVEPRVSVVAPKSPAERAGIKPGDLFLSIDGERTESFMDVRRIVASNPETSLQAEIDRGGVVTPITITPEAVVHTSRFGSARLGQLGVATNENAPTVSKRYGPVAAVKMGVQDTWSIVERTYSFVRGLFLGVENPNQIAGVVSMADLAGTVAQDSPAKLIWLVALLSVSIGLMNLLPIPILDGGHLLYFMIEAIRGRPLSERAQEWGFRFGGAFIVALMAFSLFNDVVQRVSGS
jgi:regulator of sigma E protease